MSGLGKSISLSLSFSHTVRYLHEAPSPDTTAGDNIITEPAAAAASQHLAAFKSLLLAQFIPA